MFSENRLKRLLSFYSPLALAFSQGEITKKEGGQLSGTYSRMPEVCKLAHRRSLEVERERVERRKRAQNVEWVCIWIIYM